MEALQFLLIVPIGVATLVLIGLSIRQKRLKAEAIRASALMAAAARAKTEALRKAQEEQIKAEVEQAAFELENSGRIYVRADGVILYGHNFLEFNNKNGSGRVDRPLIDEEYLTRLGWTYIGDL